MPTAKRTLFMGGLMGAGLIWLTSTKKGKEVRDQILNYAQDVYIRVEKKLRDSNVMDKVSKSEFVRKARETVDEYGDQRNIPAAIKALVLQTVLSQWDTFQKRIDKPEKKTVKSRVRRTKTRTRTARA